MTYVQLLGHAEGLPHALLLRLLAFYSLWDTEKSGDFSTRLDCYQRSSSKAAEILGQIQDKVPSLLEHSFDQTLSDWQQGMPLAYIWGIADFASRSFAVGPGVLIPREDSEVLLQQALAFTQEREHGKVLELCCGTACISLCLKVLSGMEVWASDISAQALAYARQSRDYYQVNLHLRLSDLFDHPELQQQYQLILANPPYLSTAECHKRSFWQEPQLALDGGEDGQAVLCRIIAQARNYLEPGGALLLEGAPWQMHELAALLYRSGYEQLAIYHDTAGLERVISARYWPVVL